MSLIAYIPGTHAWRRRREGILCAKTVDRIQEIVDGEIEPGRAGEVLRKHLDACRSCNAEADVIRELKVAIARVSDEADPGCVKKLEDLARRLAAGTGPPDAVE
jgi:anti-sigma factor RsiW